MHESLGGDLCASSVTPKRASSTSAIWCFDKAHLSAGERASAREERHESGCGCWVCGQAGRAAAHVAERAGGARGAGGGGRPGTASAHRHAARTQPRADTTPAPEERHYALSQPSLNEHSARHPPLGTNSIREHCCYDGRRQPAAAILSLHATRARCIV